MFNIKEEKKMRERKGGRQSRGMHKVLISLGDYRANLLKEIAKEWSENPSVMLRTALHYAMDAGEKEFITDNPGCQKGNSTNMVIWVDLKLIHYIDYVRAKTGLSKARIIRAMFDYYTFEEVVAEAAGGDEWDSFEVKVADLLYNDKVGAYNE